MGAAMAGEIPVTKTDRARQLIFIILQTTHMLMLWSHSCWYLGHHGKFIGCDSRETECVGCGQRHMVHCWLGRFSLMGFGLEMV